MHQKKGLTNSYRNFPTWDLILREGCQGSTWFRERGAKSAHCKRITLVIGYQRAIFRLIQSIIQQDTYNFVRIIIYIYVCVYIRVFVYNYIYIHMYYQIITFVCVFVHVFLHLISATNTQHNETRGLYRFGSRWSARSE